MKRNFESLVKCNVKRLDTTSRDTCMISNDIGKFGGKRLANKTIELANSNVLNATLTD